MKKQFLKLIILSTLVAISTDAFSQLGVFSSGQVLLGDTTAATLNSKIQCNLSTGESGGITFKNPTNNYGRLCMTTASNTLSLYQPYYSNKGAKLTFSNGLYYIGASPVAGNGSLNLSPAASISDHPYCLSISNNIGNAINIYSKVIYNSSDAISIVSQVRSGSQLSIKSGTSTNQSTFYVLGNGQTYTQGVLISSDASLKTDVKAIVSPLDKIMRLNGVSFRYKSQDNIEPLDFSQTSNRKDDVVNVDIMKKMINEESTLSHIGFMAQDVETIVPEVVRTSLDGTKAIAYTELIALLVEGIKEQQNMINELKENLQAITKNKQNTSIKRNFSSEVIVASLSQNSPNPFSLNTTINYTLPAEYETATIYIYNMLGTQVDKYELVNNDDSFITIEANSLEAGTYLYSLIVDGKVIDTKQMILTK